MRFRKTVSSYLDRQTKILIKNSSWVYVANMVFVLSVFLQSVVLGRILGAEHYGTYIFIVVVVETVREFLNPNVDVALVKYAAEYRAGGDEKRVAAFVKGSYLTAGAATLATAAAVGAILAVPPIRDFFKVPPGLGPYAMVFSLSRCVQFFDNISTSLLRVYDRFRLNSLIKISAGIFELGVIGGTAYIYPGNIKLLFLAASFSALLGGVFKNGAALLECRNVVVSHWGGPLSVLADRWKEIRKFVLSNSGSRTVKTIRSNGDVLLLGVLAGPAQVALYAVAKKIASSLLLLTDPMYSSIYPQLAHLKALKKTDEIKTMLRRLSVLIAVPLAVTMALGLFFNKEVMVFFYGGEYEASGRPFFLLLAASCVAVFFFWLAPLLLCFAKAFERFVIEAAVLAAGVVMAFFLTQRFGSLGMAAATLVVTVVGHSIFLYVARQELEEAG